MALKDDVLNNYFSTPLSRRKRSTDTSPSKRHRFSFDEESQINPLVSEGSKEKTNHENLTQNPEAIPLEETQNTNVSSKNPKIKNQISSTKRNQAIKEEKYYPDSFSPFYVPLKGLDIVIKKTKGLQKDILHYIADRCRASGSIDSGPIDLMDISNNYNAPLDFVKTAIKRLLEKKLIVRGPSRRGRAGYSVFYIPGEVKEIILRIQT